MTAIRQIKDITAQDGASAPAAPAVIAGPEPGVVETPTLKKICQSLAFIHDNPTIATLIGGPGIGKTTGAHIRADEHQPCSHERPAFYINMHGVRSSVSMLQTIHEAIPDGRHVDAYRNSSLMRSLAKCLAPGSLLILDEAQSLRPDALDAVRFFLDERNVGVCLLGNELVVSTISGKNARAFFSQLNSRIGFRLHIPHLSEADADAVLRAWGVSDDAGRDYGREIGLSPGGLRQLTQVLRKARLAAVATKRPIDRVLMHAAANALGLIG